MTTLERLNLGLERITPIWILAINRAASLINIGWCQYSYAKSDGCPRDWSALDATSFCLAGSVRRACFELENNENPTHILDFILAVADTDEKAADWNDTPGRTKSEVIEAFKEAIALAKERGIE